MATLFERVVGLSDDKIAINLIRGLCSEIHNERQTVQNASTIMGLDAAQEADLINILLKAQASVSSIRFSEVVFSWLALAELNVEGYDNEQAFWSMVDGESAK